MKKHFLLTGVVVLSLGILFAQSTTTLTIVEKMKAASHDFTLANELNAGQTDLKSGPLSGKKTGGIVTAEEYNRILEILNEQRNENTSGGGISTRTVSCNATFTGTYKDIGCKALCDPDEFVLGGGYSWGAIFSQNGRYSLPIKETTGGTTKEGWECLINADSCSGGLVYTGGCGARCYAICGKNSSGSSGGSGSGSSGWENVALTDTNTYNLSCIYRITTSGASGATIRYSTGVGPNSLYFGWNMYTGWIGGIVGHTDKSHFVVEGRGQHNEYNVTKMEKWCGGTGSGGSGNLECTMKDASANGRAVATCPDGYTRTGGGVWTQYCPGCGVVSAPSGDNGWESSTLPGNTTTNNHAYVVCCKGGSGSGSSGGGQITRITRNWGWRGVSSHLQSISQSSSWEARTAAWDERCVADGYAKGGWIIDMDSTAQVGFCVK